MDVVPSAASTRDPDDEPDFFSVFPLSDFSKAIELKAAKRTKLARSLTLCRVFVPAAMLASVVVLLAAALTKDFFRMEEKMPNENRTVLFGPNKSPEYLIKQSISGLFQICFTEPGGKDFSCQDIDYFPEEEYQPDQNDSTMAVPYAVIHSAWFLFLAGCLMLSAGTLTAIGCFVRRKILIFVAGVAFIISGLVLLIGLVVYVAMLKTEISTKLTAKSMLSPPRISYSYGSSFLLILAGFLVSEVAGISAIFLYMYHHQYRFICQQNIREGFGQDLVKSDANGDVVRFNNGHQEHPSTVVKKSVDDVIDEGWKYRGSANRVYGNGRALVHPSLKHAAVNCDRHSKAAQPQKGLQTTAGYCSRHRRQFQQRQQRSTQRLQQPSSSFSVPEAIETEKAIDHFRRNNDGFALESNPGGEFRGQPPRARRCNHHPQLEPCESPPGCQFVPAYYSFSSSVPMDLNSCEVHRHQHHHSRLSPSPPALPPPPPPPPPSAPRPHDCCQCVHCGFTLSSNGDFSREDSSTRLLHQVLQKPAKDDRDDDPYILPYSIDNFEVAEEGHEGDIDDEEDTTADNDSGEEVVMTLSGDKSIIRLNPRRLLSWNFDPDDCDDEDTRV